MADDGQPIVLGRIPSQQVKVDEKDETKNILKQYRTAAIVTFLLLVLIYASTNLMFGKDDWYELITIIEVALSFGVFVLLRRVLFEKFDGVYLLGDDKSLYLNTNTVIAFCVAALLFIYVRSRATDFLVVLFRYPEEKDAGTIILSVLRTTIIFITMAFIAPTVAVLLRLIVKEIPDQHHGAIEVRVNRDKLALDWAKFQEENDRYWSKNDIIIDQEESPRPLSAPMIVRAPTKALPKPTTHDERFKEAVVEFLDGLESGAWSTSERTWKGHRLSRSGYDLTAVGDTIETPLCRLGGQSGFIQNSPIRDGDCRTLAKKSSARRSYRTNTDNLRRKSSRIKLSRGNP